MLQHTSSEVTVGKNTNKCKRKKRDWYLIKKMKKIYKQTDFSLKSVENKTKPS